MTVLKSRLFGQIVSAMLCSSAFAGVAIVEEVASPERRSDCIALEKSWGRVVRWSVEYEATLEMPHEPIGKLHRIVAVAHPDKFFFYAAHDLPRHASSPTGMLWQLDPYAQELVISNGKACAQRPFNRICWEYALNEGKALPPSLAYNSFWPVVPILPLTSYVIPEADGERIVPVFEVCRSGEYIRRSTVETICGESCAIYERAGADVVWLALSKPGCVMKRETKSTVTGRIVSKLITEQLGKFERDLWLPTRFRYQFMTRSTTSPVDMVERDFHVEVLRFTINEAVPESIFAPVIKPGTQKLDRNGRVVETVAGGEDHLDQVSEFMSKYLQLPTRTGGHHVLFLWAIGGMLLGVGAFQLSKVLLVLKGPGV